MGAGRTLLNKFLLLPQLEALHRTDEGIVNLFEIIDNLFVRIWFGTGENLTHDELVQWSERRSPTDPILRMLGQIGNKFYIRRYQRVRGQHEIIR